MQQQKPQQPVVAEKSKTHLGLRFLSLLISFCIVMLAQPDWSKHFCFLASFLGFGLFWYSLSLFSSKEQFKIALVWFGIIALGHLSWLFSDHYVGKAIWLFLLFVALTTGSVFACLSKLIVKAPLSIMKCLAFAAFWTIFEWSRLFFLSGYTWDPIGLSLTKNFFSVQNISVTGVFGLSFWVLFTNLLFFRALKQRTWKNGCMALMALFLPYCTGMGLYQFYKTNQETSPQYHALLIQPSMTPEQRGFGTPNLRLTPLQQWEKVFALLAGYKNKSVDLIVLPEGAFSYGPYNAVIGSFEAQEALKKYFQVEVSFSEEEICHAYIAHLLAEIFDAHVIIGLEDYDYETHKAYNAAFVFDQERCSRYEKRILLPIAEYFPFQWCLGFAKKWGIASSFEKGQEAKVVKGKHETNLGLSICYEETFGHLMRENRKKGADILVSISNDAWYPDSRLPLVHYYHGKLRSIEQGIPQIRACNTGVTCVIDSFGNTLKMLNYETFFFKSPSEVLYTGLPLYHYKTLYTLWGDAFILIISGVFLAMSSVGSLLRRSFFSRTKAHCKSTNQNNQNSNRGS